MRTSNLLFKIKICLAAFFFPLSMLCQPTAIPPAEKMIKVSIAPDHADWTYKTGEQVKFRVQITKNSEPVRNVRIRYEVGPGEDACCKKRFTSIKRWISYD